MTAAEGRQGGPSVMKVTVTHEGGQRDDFTIKPVTVVAFERNFGVGLGALSGEGSRMEYVYWLAWHAEKATGAVVKPFDGWLEDVLDVTADEEQLPLS